MLCTWAVFLLFLGATPGFVQCAFVGGATPVDISNPNLRTVSVTVVSSMAEANDANVPCPDAFVLVNATQQVVAGVRYYLNYVITPEKCPENHRGNLEAGKLCKITVWRKPWEGFQEVQRNTCLPDKTPKKLIGGGDHDIGHMGLFKKFVLRYSKRYANEKEFNKRFRVFRMNMKKVRKLQETEQGTATYGATQFADLTAEEFERYYLGLKPRMRASNRYVRKAKIPTDSIPDSYDWRDQGVVTPVKNQGMCGSCWAFSVTGNVEGQWAIANGSLLSLSEQELVDCDKLDSGCRGGEMTNAYEQIMKLGGLETEGDYPYEGDDEKCSFKKPLAKVDIHSYVNVSSNETEMAHWLYKNGPISIGINANVMQFYFGGISHPWKIFCEPSGLDHGVLIVGYGQQINQRTKKVIPFWIVKNSWGGLWGEEGYYRVFRGDGTCGLNLMATSAII